MQSQRPDDDVRVLCEELSHLSLSPSSSLDKDGDVVMAEPMAKDNEKADVSTVDNDAEMTDAWGIRKGEIFLHLDTLLE